MFSIVCRYFQNNQNINLKDAVYTCYIMFVCLFMKPIELN